MQNIKVIFYVSLLVEVVGVWVCFKFLTFIKEYKSSLVCRTLDNDDEVSICGARYRGAAGCLGSYLLLKRYMIQINNKDTLCCARAIVTARARIDNYLKWHSIRQGSCEQLHLARQLHIATSTLSMCMCMLSLYLFLSLSCFVSH